MARPTLIYDGDCGFCSACIRFIERRIPTKARLVPWQRINLDEYGLTEAQCAQAVQWIGTDGWRGAGPVAVGYLLRDAGTWWKPLGWLLSVPPGRWLAAPVYRWVAAHRHQLPGGTPACSIRLTESNADGPITGVK